MKRTLYWNKQALHVFSRAFDRIRKRSVQHAQQAEDEILSAINQLMDDPAIYPADRFMRGNTGGYRAFELHRHRISYFADETSVIILRIMHVRKRSR